MKVCLRPFDAICQYLYTRGRRNIHEALANEGISILVGDRAVRPRTPVVRGSGVYDANGGAVRPTKSGLPTSSPRVATKRAAEHHAPNLFNACRTRRNQSKN